MPDRHIRAMHLHTAGPVQGLQGFFAGGQTLYVDMDTMEVVDSAPFAQTPLYVPVEEELAVKETSKKKAAVKAEDIPPASAETPIEQPDASQAGG